MAFVRTVASALCSWAVLRAAALRSLASESFAYGGGAETAQEAILAAAAGEGRGQASFPIHHASWALAREARAATAKGADVLGGASDFVRQRRQVAPPMPRIEHVHVVPGVGLRLRSHMSGEDVALPANQPTFYTLKARDLRTNEYKFDVGVPREWSGMFEEDSIRFVSERGLTQYYVARLAADPTEQVMFKRAPSQLMETQRELQVVNLLSADRAITRKTHGSVETTFDTRAAGGVAFFLVEAGDITLEDRVTARNSSQPFAGMVMPLTSSLPILVDVLQACRELEAVGLTHGALSPANIFLSGDRAIVRGLSSVCSGGCESVWSCSSMADQAGSVGPFATSPFWQPPEALNGAPVGCADHTWVVGMLFAYMCLGYNLVEDFILSSGTTHKDAASSVRGRRAIRTVMNLYFRVDGLNQIRDLDEDVRFILNGLLAPIAVDRWSTEQALEEVRKFAQARSIALPEPRQRPALTVALLLDEGLEWPGILVGSEAPEDTWQ